MLEVIGNWVQIVGLPIALAALYFGHHQSQRSRELEVTLSLMDAFRTRWESDGRATVSAVEAAQATGQKVAEEL